MKSLDKALNVLDLIIKNARPEISTTELSRISGLNKPSVSRIAATLVKHGYLMQKKKRGKYSLGSVFMNYIQIISNNSYFRNIVRNVAVPHLTLLSNKINELAVIAFSEGSDDIVLEPVGDEPALRSSSQYSLKVSINSSIKAPLHSTSVGKIFLADLPGKKLEDYFNSRPLVSRTSFTITDMNQMRNQIKRVRRNGVACDDEESNPGIKSIAVGIRDNDGELIAAIGIAAPATRLTRKKMTELGSMLKNVAAVISGELDSINFHHAG